MTTSLIAALRNITGAEHVLEGKAAMPYFQDQRGNYSGDALAVILPADVRQVSEVVKLLAAQQIAIVPQGGNTSLCGGAVPLDKNISALSDRQVVVNLSRMNNIRAFDAANYTMTVEAGCTLARVREAAAKQGRLFPLSLSAVDSRCEIGGNLSTNAGGTGVLRYGNMRDLVLGLEVVLPDGRIWNGLRSLRKDNTGYDLKNLFIGAEGTLGIITAAVLKLYPQPRAKATACVAVRDPAAAVALLAQLRATCGDRINAFEIVSRTCLDLVLKHYHDTGEPFAKQHDWIVLCELADVLDVPLDAALHHALANTTDGVIENHVSSDAAQTAAWWNLRKYISDAQKLEGKSIKHDVAVPISNVPSFIAQTGSALQQAFPGIRIVAFGHIGDGNIHYNASMPQADANAQLFAQSAQVNSIVYDIVHRLHGTISAEHGVGQLKRDEIKRYKDPLELELMRKIKDTLDPHGLMNPGKVI